MNSATRDIEEHKRRALFRRLIEYGPPSPDDPECLTSDNRTTLSDPECGSCVEFIYSHMINRFKGDLAELLALDPCIQLITQLCESRRLQTGGRLFVGNSVRQRSGVGATSGGGGTRQQGFTYGADGLLVAHTGDILNVQGVVEIKSAARTRRQLLAQINSHIARLSGGVRLDGTEWVPSQIVVAPEATFIRVMVVPSDWKLSRAWSTVRTSRGSELVFPAASRPPLKTTREEVEPNLWKITLDWSAEALERAAYEMTFWYMGQVGSYVYAGKAAPEGWEMTSQQAGRNAIKQMLYFTLVRYISARQARLATRLYNVYCFGYTLGVDNKEMLWPEDLDVIPFVTDECELRAGFQVQASLVYSAAEDWAARNRTTLPDRTEFLKRLGQYANLGTTKDAYGNDVLQGIRLRRR